MIYRCYLEILEDVSKWLVTMVTPPKTNMSSKKGLFQ